MDETKQTSPPEEFVVTVGGRIVAKVYEEAIAALLVEALREIASADFHPAASDQTEPEEEEVPELLELCLDRYKALSRQIGEDEALKLPTDWFTENAIENVVPETLELSLREFLHSMRSVAAIVAEECSRGQARTKTNPNQDERADEAEETPTGSLVVLSKNKKWIGTLIDHRTGQICLEALSGHPGIYRLSEIPKHPPLVEKAALEKRGEAA